MNQRPRNLSTASDPALWLASCVREEPPLVSSSLSFGTHLGLTNDLMVCPKEERKGAPGRFQRLDLFIKVLSLLCPNLTDNSFWCSSFVLWRLIKGLPILSTDSPAQRSPRLSQNSFKTEREDQREIPKKYQR